MSKKYICTNCKKDVELPSEMEEDFAVCPDCGSNLTIVESEESEWYKIEEESLVSDDTVYLNNPGKESLINTVRPIEESLYDLSKIDKYILHEEIGRGAMSVILGATDKNIRRRVAMKVMPKAADEEVKTRFLEEAQVIGQLEHPNIVPIHDIGIDTEGRLFFTMKLVHGRSLGDILDDLRKEDKAAEEEYPQLRLLRSFVSICNAIAFAHSQGVIHRDLKPDNIMIGDYGEVLVMDWGLARIVNNSEVRQINKTLNKIKNDNDKKEALLQKTVSTISKDIGAAGIRQTIDGHIIGTPLYMSPEQARGEISKIDQRSDIYGLGAILYEIITLNAPIQDGNVETVLKDASSGKIIDPEKRNPEKVIPKELAAITRKALSYSPHNRYQSVKMLRDDINLYIAGYSVSAKQDSSIEAFVKLLKRNKAASFVSAVAIIILMMISGLFRTNIKNERKKAITAIEEKEKAEEEKLLAEQKKKELEEKLLAENKREWQLVFHEKFSSNTISNDWIFRGNGYIIQDGKLHIPASEDAERRLILKKPLVGDLRIEFECHQEGDFLNDVTCFLGALRGNSGETFDDYGYIFQYGGNSNTINSLQRYRSAALWSEKASPLKKGITYHVRAEKIGKRLSLIVNDEEVFSVEDSNPLEGPERSGVGLYSWGSDIWYDNIKIYTLAPPIKADILDLAERYLRTGHYQTSIDLFDDVISSTTDRERRLRAFMGTRKAKAQLQLRKKYERYNSKLLRSWNNTDFMIEIEEEKLSIMLKGENIKSLTPLTGMEFNKITINRCALKNLDNISKIKFEQLTISDTPLLVLPVIDNPRLTEVRLHNTEIINLTPLKNLPLKIIAFDIDTTNSGIDTILEIPTLEVVITPQLGKLPPAQFEEAFKEYLNQKN